MLIGESKTRKPNSGYSNLLLEKTATTATIAAAASFSCQEEKIAAAGVLPAAMKIQNPFIPLNFPP